MLTKQEANEIVLASLVELNEEKEEEDKIPVSVDTILLGTDAELDSMDLIYLITNIENRLYELAETEIQLAVGAEAFEGNHPFRNVGTLGEHIAAIMRLGAK